MAIGIAGVLAAAAIAGQGNMSTVAGTGAKGYSGDGGPGASARLAQPLGVDVAGEGRVLIADTKNNRIRRILPGGTIFTVAGRGSRGYSGDGGPATSARLGEPAGVAHLPDGGFLIADTDNNRIRRVNADGRIFTVAGDGRDWLRGDGGPARHASLDEPRGVAPTADGGFLIADSGHDRIRKVSPGGVITTVAGRVFASASHNGGDDGFKGLGDGGPARQASLDDPGAVATTADGGFLIADTRHHRVRRVDPAGRISTVAGNGFRGWGGDGKPATQARLSEPAGLSVLADGGYLVADGGNNRVRQVGSDGIIGTVAGSADAAGNAIDPLATKLHDPAGVTTDGHGGFYFADSKANRVRLVAGGLGALSTLAPPSQPVAGKRFNVAPVKGVVRVKLPRRREAVVLTASASLPVGSAVDTRRGVVELTSAKTLGRATQSAVFRQGAFKVTQKRARRPVTELRLTGGSFSSCTHRKHASKSGVATIARKRSKFRRRLWGRGKGHFRTRGRHGAATVRGTTWFTADRCDGTYVKVKHGVVAVRTFGRRKQVLVTHGEHTLARRKAAGAGKK